ncbi:serine protease [Candidatus Parabeggiatoa sp. HSG14]|uniref:serine protease n=1 Tax=Candidatus Parabeggiatoa sp. HSG14 TaxID=3055593 RepID=UPI0025A76A42|nr:serine protease [Thiotrichales bacterium HSG14]
MKFKQLFVVCVFCVVFTSTSLWSQEISSELNTSPNSLSDGELNGVKNSQRIPRIIGGKDAQAGVWPWITYIGYTSDPEGYSSCGGSLIHPYWVLTAAHCVDGFNLGDPPLTGDDMFAVVGLHKRNRTDTEGERLTINRVIQHPQWNRLNPSWYYDIALVQLKEPSTQQLLSLPLQDNIDIKPNTLATAVGWGIIEPKADGASPDVLQEVELSIVSNETCQTTYEGEYKILDSMICAGFEEGKKDTCTNDSGGPLVIFKESQWQQVGIVSFGGHKTEGAPICAGPDAYGVYTRVSAFIDFIAKYVPLPIAGAYDGVWTSTLPTLANTYFVLRNTADTIAIAILTDNGKNWYALLGAMGIPTSTMTSVISTENMMVEFKPILTESLPITEITLTVINCRTKQSSADTCLLPMGKNIKLNKMF